MVAIKSSNVRTNYGSITVHQWFPTDAPPKYILFCIHGMMEHGGRYAEFASHATKHGAGVVAPDLIGFGESTNRNCRLGEIPSEGWEAYLEVISTAYQSLSDEYKTLPLIVLGHSMGSFVALHALAEDALSPQAVVCLGSASIHPVLGHFAQGVAKLMSVVRGEQRSATLLHYLVFSGYNKGFDPIVSDYDWLSSDPIECQKYLADAHCGQVPSNRFFYHLFKSFGQLKDKEFIQKIPKDIPLLFLSGDADPLSKGGASVDSLVDSYKEAGIQDISFERITEQRHELLHDTKRSETIEQILSWIQGQLKKK